MSSSSSSSLAAVHHGALVHKNHNDVLNMVSGRSNSDKTTALPYGAAAAEANHHKPPAHPAAAPAPALPLGESRLRHVISPEDISNLRVMDSAASLASMEEMMKGPATHRPTRVEELHLTDDKHVLRARPATASNSYGHSSAHHQQQRQQPCSATTTSSEMYVDASRAQDRARNTLDVAFDAVTGSGASEHGGSEGGADHPTIIRRSFDNPRAQQVVRPPGEQIKSPPPARPPRNPPKRSGSFSNRVHHTLTRSFGRLFGKGGGGGSSGADNTNNGTRD